MSPSPISMRNRLKIEDLLDIAASEQLKSFRWADGLCNAVNAYLSLDHRLTITDTGDRVAAVIRGLPSSVQIRLSFVLIDVETGEVVLSRTTLDGFPTVPDDVEGEDTSGRAPPVAGYERYEDEANLGEVEEVRGPRYTPRGRMPPSREAPPNSTIMMMIAATLVAVALIMTFTASKISKETGAPMESNTLEVVLKVLGDVFKSSANTNPATRSVGTGESVDDTSVPEDSSVEDTSTGVTGEEVEATPRYRDEEEPSGGGPTYGN